MDQELNPEIFRPEDIALYMERLAKEQDEIVKASISGEYTSEYNEIK